MAVNVSNRKGNVKNIRSHALNTTKKRQKLIRNIIELSGIFPWFLILTFVLNI